MTIRFVLASQADIMRLAAVENGEAAMASSVNLHPAYSS